MSREAEVHSPLSTAPPRKLRDLPKNFILEQLERYYQDRPDPRIVECDYSLWQCSETRLEFAWPPLPGNAAFYEWVSGFESYYPGGRWEYQEVSRLLLNNKPASSFEVLDVGCGKGDFLRGLDFLPAGARFALDLNQPAVEACRRQGFQSFCGKMETALASGFVKPSQFRAVTSFHCLEHVDGPADFVRSLARVTAPGGRIFLSTPYSPMSFESDWFDVLNHPPHHLTRWNQTAYRKLAELLGLKMRWFAPASSVVRRTLGTFRLLQYGPNRSVGRIRLLADLSRHLPALARLYGTQRQRGRESGGIAADVILVEFTVPANDP